ncbi:TIGR03084 family metal-binding protein [Streptomyces sp. NPDC059373]
MADPTYVLSDLRDESQDLDELVSGLADQAWATPTPAQGWTIAHQIAHLAWTDGQSLLAVTDPDAFAREVADAMASLDTYVDEAAEQGAALPPPELLARWRTSRTRLAAALTAQPPGARFPWYGTAMSTASMATGRLMETWAHGEDIADALAVRRAPTARLRHVARIGVRARDYAYAARGLEPPTEEFRVELTSPTGELWTYGPEDAPQRVTGPALDFCLLATRRRHRADLTLTTEGKDADHWLDIAQAFAGPPGTDREPRG